MVAICCLWLPCVAYGCHVLRCVAGHWLNLNDNNNNNFAGHRCSKHSSQFPQQDEVRKDQFQRQWQHQEGGNVRHLLGPHRRVLQRAGQVQDPAKAAPQLVRGRLRWLCELAYIIYISIYFLIFFIKHF